MEESEKVPVVEGVDGGWWDVERDGRVWAGNKDGKDGIRIRMGREGQQDQDRGGVQLGSVS